MFCFQTNFGLLHNHFSGVVQLGISLSLERILRLIMRWQPRMDSIQLCNGIETKVNQIIEQNSLADPHITK